MRLSLKLLFNSLEKELQKIIEKNINTIPFYINRTLSDNLAVFVKYRNNGNIAFTHVRKVKGNRYILKEELQQIVGKTPIRVNKDCFVIQGNHKHKIKQNTDGVFVSVFIFLFMLFTLVVCWSLYERNICSFYNEYVSPDLEENHRKND